MSQKTPCGLTRKAVAAWDQICAHVGALMIANNAKSLFLEITDAKEGDFEYTLNPPNHRNPHAAAERMLDALTNLKNDDGAIPPSAWEMVQTAITDAGGTPKGPPQTDIRAEVAALRQFLAWAMATLKKAAHYEDRASASICWDALNSHEGDSARLLIKTLTGANEPDAAADLATALIEQPLLERIAALRTSLAWAINTFQGESGCGDAYWEQFPEYLTACALLADANPQPKDADTDSPLPCDECYWEGLEAEGTLCENCEAEANTQPKEEAP